jgi:hypothetical protein
MLKLTHLQQRDDHWAIVDLFGKGGHVRTVLVPRMEPHSRATGLHVDLALRHESLYSPL